MLKIGTRNSKLALIQTRNSLHKLHELFPDLSFEIIPFSTPGDRDKKSDLRLSPSDFFTRDLDTAIIDGKIDAAVHSAKDLAYPVKDGLDWFWLPWNEDQRDVLVLSEKFARNEEYIKNSHLSNCFQPKKIGVSSKRREQYCRKRFPDAELIPVRGNIEERLAQLDNGAFDLLIMAAAGLKRLNLSHRISEYIPIHELAPPDGQGYLAVTFKKGNNIFTLLRQMFVKPVLFVGAGPGDPDLLTAAGIRALKDCEVCLYDALISEKILSYVPDSAKSIFVGKRKAKHSLKQDEICEMLIRLAREGKRVVRLKGGDPCIFGRLAEETRILTEYSLPFRVIPGISSLNASAAYTGLLPTRRGVSRGFIVLTTRKSGSANFEYVSENEKLNFPHIFFMGISEIPAIALYMIKEGYKKNLPAAIIFSTANENQKTVTSTLEELCTFDITKLPRNSPGLLIVGQNASSQYLFKIFGPLAGKRVLLTCSDTLMEKAVNKVHEFGGIPIPMPMIKLIPEEGAIGVLKQIDKYDWIILTSPSAVRCFIYLMNKACSDLRTIPRIAVCGKETYAEFGRYGIYPDFETPEPACADSLLKSLKHILRQGEKILRFKSDVADSVFSYALKDTGAIVEECILYKNTHINYDTVPDFDYIVFASPSAVKNFFRISPPFSLHGKVCVAIGKPTKKILTSCVTDIKILTPQQTSMENCIFSLALLNVKGYLLAQFG